jgi:hypothetical protein
MATLTAKHSNGAPDTTAIGVSLEDARNRMAAQMIRLYGDDVYLEYFADRGLVWTTEEDSIDDDGARAVASIYDTEVSS